MSPPHTLTLGPPDGDHLTFAVTDIDPDAIPGAGDLLCASVSIYCGVFRAVDCGCLVLAASLETFITDLRRFEETRVGHVTLDSLAGEFTLTLASDRPTEWPTLTGTVIQNVAQPDHGQLHFGFRLDSSFVGQILQDFERLLAHCRRA